MVRGVRRSDRSRRLVGSTGMGAAEYEAHGLYDPNASNAADRLALLEWLADRGLSVGQMAEAAAAGRLTAIAGDLALRPGQRLSMLEVAESTGLTVDQVKQLSLTIGLPVEEVDEHIYTPSDVAVFKLFRETTELFPEPALMQFVRVLGGSLSRIADAAVSLFLSDVETPITDAQAGELALARAQLDAISALNLLTEHLDALFRAHMELAVRRNTAARTEASSKITVFVAVGFVDLVGFTPLAQQLPVRELHSIVDEFEGSAYDIVTSRRGRVVKLIGDEVMFVALEPQDACEIALALVDRFAESASNVTPRGGLAVGEILSRGGDYYGPVVNLASRIADLAVPNEILVTSEMRDRIGAAVASLTFDAAGRRMLKGFDEPVELFALRRA
jgi:adenylate cyclase